METNIPGLLNISDGVAGFIKIHRQNYQTIPEAVKCLIVFAAEQLIQSETESKDQMQLPNNLERFVADETDDNGDEDQSEHEIELKHLTKRNDEHKKNDSLTLTQATVNGEANPEINITKTSANTPPHNVYGSDGLGRNGCGTQLLAATNKNGHLNHPTTDNTGNVNIYEQSNDN
ncbi:MAG: hypothetical protein EZS28_054754 [Streblomastix strix]|uniref:Uncharacterized protein n=1 Tax=Streblomastix strix TaxID=222440 RepID=A0A5J4QG62_9EUKA|nr:MAG: hypothetical protein EZS28_054754 [Streblomastix strix]